MQSGKMRTPFIVETSADVISDSGEAVKVWTAFKSGLFGEFRATSGNELLKAGKVQAEMSHAIKTRFVSGLLPSMRINRSGIYYDIVSAVPDRTGAKDVLIYANEKVQ